MQSITVEYLKPTEHRKARLKAKCHAGSITIDAGVTLDHRDYWGSKDTYLIERTVALALIAKMGWNQLVKITGAGRDYRGHVVFTLTQNRVQQAWERQWFALLACGNLAPLGDHGDYEAAEATASDLGLEVIWLADADTITQWQKSAEFVKADILGQSEYPPPVLAK